MFPCTRTLWHRRTSRLYQSIIRMLETRYSGCNRYPSSVTWLVTWIHGHSHKRLDCLWVSNKPSMRKHQHRYANSTINLQLQLGLLNKRHRSWMCTCLEMRTLCITFVIYTQCLGILGYKACFLHAHSLPYAWNQARCSSWFNKQSHASCIRSESAYLCLWFSRAPA